MRKFSLILFLLLSSFTFTGFSFGEKSSPVQEINQVSNEYTELKKEIIALYNANKIKEAYNLIATVPEIYRDGEMWLLAANITQDYGRDLDAITLLEKSISVEPDNYKPYYNLGVIYLNDKKYYTAIKYFESAVKYNVGFAPAYYNLGCCYLGVGEYKKAKKAFMRAISYDSRKPDYYYNLAYTYKLLNNRKQASKMMEIYNNLKAK